MFILHNKLEIPCDFEKIYHLFGGSDVNKFYIGDFSLWRWSLSYISWYISIIMSKMDLNQVGSQNILF